jgi:hypothetical protein
LKKLKRLISYVLITCLAGILGIFLVAPVSHANTPLVCNMSTVTGDDDGSFPMTLPFSLQLGNTNYNQIYYSTNGLMSFGRPDGNFWSYPQTPSVTLAGRDWVSFGPGAYTSYGYNENSFCIEWSVRPFPQSSGPLTQIRLVVNVFPNGGWHGEITTLGWIPPDIRRGIVWEQNGTPLPIGAAFDVNGGVPIEVPPAPAPTSFTQPPAIPIQCWNGSTVYAPATCPPVPPDITCWNGEIVPWNGSCQQVPPPIECWNGTSVNWNAQCPTRTLNPPSNVIGEVRADGVYVSWDPPYDPFTSVEAYAISWQCNGCAGYGWSSINTSVLIPFSTFDYTGGTGREYTFSVRADNNTTATYSSNTVGPTLFVQEPIASPEPQPSVSPEPTVEPSPQPIEPSPMPSEPVVLPSENPSPIPVPSFSSPSEYPWQPEGPVAVPSLDPEPEISFPELLTPDPIESSFPDLDLPSIDLPSNNVITEITDTEIDTFVENFTQSGTISDIETEQLINIFLGDGFISEDEVSGLSDSLNEDGVLTEDERELLVDVILEQADGNAISTELIDELGLDYEDLPDDQPVMLDNGVILFAEVADALEIFENPSEILGAVFTDPGKALTAVANIGADMTPEQREESQTVVVASIIVGQIISTTNLITGRIR